MSSGAVEVRGAKQLRRTLKQAGDDLHQMRNAHRDAAKVAETAAKPLVPVGPTGRLARTVRSSGSKTRATLRAGTARVPYAGPIHWGWRKRNITANPFLSQGAQTSEPRWIRIYESYIESTIHQIQGA